MAIEISKTNGLSKKSKKQDTTRSPSATPTSGDHSTTDEIRNGDAKAGSQENHDNPYIRELQKNIRNISKKLSAMQKVDSIIAENPDTGLDDLVAARKINQDQKAQALKKPSLQASLTQFEEQISQYRKSEEDFQKRSSLEREQLQASHQQELDALRATHAAETTSRASKNSREKLLVLSMFLRAAAARRQLEDDSSEESKAFEGVLLLLYGGDEAAVDAAEKLIDGASEQVTSTEGTALQVTYDEVKKLSVDYAPFAAESSWAQGVADAEQPAATNGDSDPTRAHAGLTELIGEREQAPTIDELQPAILEAQPTTLDGTSDNANITSEASNAAATEQWDKNAVTASDSMGESWVTVPRDPAQTELPHTSGAANVTQNWADDVPEPARIEPTALPADDGFHEVHHSRGGKARGSGTIEPRGGQRGRGGFRSGEGGGRGRGGFRGDRGGGGEGRGRGRGGRSSRGREAV